MNRKRVMVSRIERWLEGEKAAKESLPEIKTRLSLVSSIIYGLKRLGGKHHGG
ncbi:MAG TPA: hypothetical protein PLT64_03030 [Syntrophales bacterium]|nr:hypothetical protein [Syntrophales bacterium]HOL58827.1 hypothetical protein [Syntrophales bacterium]HPO35154.1 hypothetical protein [Syntrophales bacterium]